MDASTPQDKMLQNKYPPTIEIMVGKGPRQARVYCARPPVVLGIRAFNSDRDAIVVMLSRQAMIIAGIKAIPMVPAPCPRETRQLVAMTRPTETEITLFSPSFFLPYTAPFVEHQPMQNSPSANGLTIVVHLRYITSRITVHPHPHHRF